MPVSFPDLTPDPSGRPALVGLRFLLVHFTGVGVRFNDPTKDVAYAREVCGYRKWEYNYIVGLGGGVYSQAGDFLAGHCLNFSMASIGVILTNAIGVPSTKAQQFGLLGLRKDLVARGVLTYDHEVHPHYGFRDTGCPGNMLAELPGKAKPNSPTAQGRYGQVIPELRLPLTAVLTPTPPPAAPIPAFPPFVPASGLFSLYPIARNKPTLRLLDNGDLVRYLQGVLKVKCGQGVAIDGRFGSQTDRAVRSVQAYFRLTVDGIVGPQTWRVIDFVASR